MAVSLLFIWVFIISHCQPESFEVELEPLAGFGMGMTPSLWACMSVCMCSFCICFLKASFLTFTCEFRQMFSSPNRLTSMHFSSNAACGNHFSYLNSDMFFFSPQERNVQINPFAPQALVMGRCKCSDGRCMKNRDWVNEWLKWAHNASLGVAFCICTVLPKHF